MKFESTALREVVRIEPVVHGDARGWFMESFQRERFEHGLTALGLPPPPPFVQDNESHSAAGVLRGVHYQLPPHAQGKLVRVVAGAVFDVAVDMRRSSPTFGRWVGVELSAANRHQLWIPPGFGHAFLALAPDTRFLYKTTEVYARDCERAVRWDDPAIGIVWPRPPAGAAGPWPQLAAKDAQAPGLDQADCFP